MNKRKGALEAIAADDVAQLRKLLSDGVSPNQKEQVGAAAAQAGRGIVQPMTAPNVQMSLLHIACQCAAMGCVKLLVESRAEVMSSTPTVMGNIYPLDLCLSSRAALGQNLLLDMAAVLINAHADPNVCGRDPDGCTALMVACQDGNAMLARFFLEHGADPNLGKTNGSTCLFKACQNGYADVCRMLVGAKAHLDVKFQSGCTPIGAAANMGHEACVRILLAAGADKNVVAHDGQTPLMLATTSRRTGCVAMLTQAHDASRLLSPPEPALPSGGRVRVNGLQGRPELNGQVARVLEFDVLKGRYNVCFFDGERVALKPSNLTLVTTTDDDSSVVSMDMSDTAVNAATVAMRTATTPVTFEELMQAIQNPLGVAWAEKLLSRRDVDLNRGLPSPPERGPELGRTTTLLLTSAAAMTHASSATMHDLPKTRSGDPYDAVSELMERLPASAGATGIAPTVGMTQTGGGGDTTTGGGGGGDGGTLVALPRIVRALLEHGADVDRASDTGVTPLLVACGCGLVDNVHLLLAHGADVNARAKGGDSPLLRACNVAGKVTTLRGYSPALASLECARALLATGRLQDVNVRDDAGYPALTAGIEWFAPVALLSLLIEHRADVNANTTDDDDVPGRAPVPSPLCAASTGMRMMGGQVRADVIDLLLGARADATIECAHPDMRTGSRRTPQEWAVRASQGEAAKKAIVALFAKHETFEQLASEMVEAGMLDEGTIDEMTDRIAEGALSEAEAKEALHALRREGEEAVREQRVSAQQEITRAFMALHGAGAARSRQSEGEGGSGPSPAEPETGTELPRGTMAVFGGRVELTGVKSDAALNGQYGRVLSWNEGDKRRFGVRLEASGRVLSLKPRNLLPIDADPFPQDFTCSSSELCSTLQEELRASGLTCKVVDWTPLAAAMADVVHLLWMAHLSEDRDSCIYVQRTTATAPFFLCHREIVCPTLPQLSSCPNLTTVPWMMLGPTITAIPSPWYGCCERAFIIRLCLHCFHPTRQCTICLEDMPTHEHPSQLPCVHFMCSTCLRKQFPVSGHMTGRTRDGAGLTCPTCKLHFPNHRIFDHPGAVGGLAITEYCGKE